MRVSLPDFDGAGSAAQEGVPTVAEVIADAIGVVATGTEDLWNLQRGIFHLDYEVAAARETCQSGCIGCDRRMEEARLAAS